MYCPNCATNNLDGARFCRSCGADISLVPQALTGHLPEKQFAVNESEEHRGSRRGRKNTPSMDKAIKGIFTGLGFLMVTIALAFTPMGRAWWFWMFIPAFATLGGGVAEYIRFKQSQQSALPPIPTPSSMSAASSSVRSHLPPPRAAAVDLPRRNTAELVTQPPSVTEGTTRLLEDEAPTRHIGRAAESISHKSGVDP